MSEKDAQEGNPVKGAAELTRLGSIRIASSIARSRIKHRMSVTGGSNAGAQALAKR